MYENMYINDVVFVLNSYLDFFFCGAPTFSIASHLTASLFLGNMYHNPSGFIHLRDGHVGQYRPLLSTENDITVSKGWRNEESQCTYFLGWAMWARRHFDVNFSQQQSAVLATMAAPWDEWNWIGGWNILKFQSTDLIWIAYTKSTLQLICCSLASGVAPC